MKGFRPTPALTPAAAILSALATLACCLPWGIGAALGALGLSAVFARFQIWFLILSVALLLVGLVQAMRKRPNCSRRSGLQIALWSIAAAIVAIIALFPQWVSALMADLSP